MILPSWKLAVLLARTAGVQPRTGTQTLGTIVIVTVIDILTALPLIPILPPTDAKLTPNRRALPLKLALKPLLETVIENEPLAPKLLDPTPALAVPVRLKLESDGLVVDIWKWP